MKTICLIRISLIFPKGPFVKKMLLFQAMIWHPAGEKAITLTDGELNDRCHMASLGLT